MNKFLINIELTGDTKQYSTDRTFTLSLKKRNADLILEHGNVIQNPTSVSKAKSLTTTANNAPKTLTNFINNAWKECKNEFNNSGNPIKIVDIVMAKMQTFSPWPGKITGFTKDKKRANIYFFGDHNVGEHQ